jgi:multiple sugar transport system substrate-binding protein
MNKLIALSGALGLSSLCASTALAATDITMWYHGAGNPVEREIIVGIIDDFNASQPDWKVNLEEFPQAAYNDSVTAAALAGKLPDIIDVDGPVMPNWAWSGYMAPLEISEEELADFLPGPIGKWGGKLYSVGLWDAAVAMVTRKSTLDEFGIRVPTLTEPWTGEEFEEALQKIKASGKFEYPLDLGMAWTGEWYPYAFSPFLQSFGGDIVDRSTYKTAEGALNGEAALKFGEWWQHLFTEKLVPGTSQDPADRDSGFANGKYAISWNGNWAALGALAAFDDVLFLPAPDFGNGPKIGAASWQFGVSASSKNKDGATAFIRFALQDKYLTAFSDGIGLIPPTPASAAASKNYAEGGPMAVFYDLSKVQALVRPVTPGYVVAAKVFEKALADIANGANVADTLDAAVDEINADIEKNGGYGH